MFGGLDLFKDEKYLEEHSKGYLFLPDKTCDLEIFAVMSVDAYNENIFMPVHDNEVLWEITLDYIKDKSSVYKNTKLAKGERILAMSTCSNLATNERTVVFAKIKTNI